MAERINGYETSGQLAREHWQAFREKELSSE